MKKNCCKKTVQPEASSSNVQNFFFCLKARLFFLQKDLKCWKTSLSYFIDLNVANVYGFLFYHIHIPYSGWLISMTEKFLSIFKPIENNRFVGSRWW